MPPMSSVGPDDDPGDLVRRLHRELGQTSGAAVAVAELDVVEARVRFAGLGDIAGVVVEDGESRRDLACLPGTAGDGTPEIRQDEYPLGADASVVLHSRGVSADGDVADYPGLFAHAPQVVAATLLRDAGTRYADAGVAVARTV